MAATTTDRNTRARLIERQIRLVLKEDETIPAGAMVATQDADGLAVNASDTAGLTVQGRAEAAASYAAGDREIVVSRGVFQWANNGNVVQASVGELLEVIDNQTVGLAADGANNIGAGYCEEVTSEGVWVSMLGGKVAAT
jgi:hypothetical protein